MKSLWSEADAARFIDTYAGRWGEEFALRLYLSALVGAEEGLAPPGGGSASLKSTVRSVLGDDIPVLCMAAAGRGTPAVQPEDFLAMDLEFLRRLRSLGNLSAEELVTQLRIHRLDTHEGMPPAEAVVHAALPGRYVDRTQADAVLALMNQAEARRWARAALGPEVIVLECGQPGLPAARAAAAALQADPGSRAILWMGHGLLTWGETARDAYESLVELTTRAEDFRARAARKPAQVAAPARAAAEERCGRLLPVVRGLMARPTGNPDTPHRRVVLQALVTQEILDLLAADGAEQFALTAPLAWDHAPWTHMFPLWIDAAPFEDADAFRDVVRSALEGYIAACAARMQGNAPPLPAAHRPESFPRVVLIPGMGVVGAGKDARAARLAAEIAVRTLRIKTELAAQGAWAGIPQGDLVAMERASLWRSAPQAEREPPLARHVALVTGAAGAIGSAIAEELLENGCHVAVSDVAADRLSTVVEELRETYGSRVTGVVLDVTDEGSVAAGFRAAARTWGGVDLVVVNAGMALVAPLSEMDLETFRRLERVNVEGTLLVLAEAARHFRLQGTGGDIVVISTKNVFSPGAHFGAYSATKSAAHQLGRIASLELAPMDVRVNMVSPDAVFAHKGRRSGLWAEVGPSRMAARGLDAEGLEEYYRNRNLLKARVTAQHVARAVLFFATRQTPTTGATLPVDGGLPDATPR